MAQSHSSFSWDWAQRFETRLFTQADKFHKTGKQLRSKMWWQNMRMKIVVVVAVLVLILVIFLLVRSSKLGGFFCFFSVVLGRAVLFLNA